MPRRQPWFYAVQGTLDDGQANGENMQKQGGGLVTGQWLQGRQLPVGLAKGQTLRLFPVGRSKKKYAAAGDDEAA